jgi:magnesium transporter
MIFPIGKKMSETNDLDNNYELLKSYWDANQEDKLREALHDFPTGTVIEFFETLEEIDIIKCLSLVDVEDKGRLFSYLPIEEQYTISQILDKKEFSVIFSSMYSDLRADLYQMLEANEQIDLLPYLSKKIREDVIVLSSYPPETAGGIMSTDFSTVHITMTCNQAINKIRQDAPQKMIYYIYVTNDNMELLGIVTLKDLILSDPKDIIREKYNENVIYAYVSDDQEKVAKEIEKHDLMAIPILNGLNQIVGIITHEDAIDIIRAEHTEDMEKFMGIVPSDGDLDYLSMSSLGHFKKRVFWLVSLAAVGLISGIIIHQYQSVLEQLIILALYMPMMTATGGNTGSQAATLVIRAIALDEITEKDWLKILFKEAQVSILLGFCVGLLVFIKIAYLTSLSLFPPQFTTEKIAFLISLALALQVFSSALVGAGLPLLVRKLKGDPAVAASPAITTVVDITGLLIYFSVASSILQ